MVHMYIAERETIDAYWEILLSDRNIVLNNF